MFEGLVARIEELFALVKTFPRVRWAVVTSVSPLAIRFDLEADPLEGKPSTLVGGLTLGARVLVVVQSRRVTVIGKAGGGPHAASQATVNAGTDTQEYVTPATLAGRPYFIANLASGFLSPSTWVPLTSLATWDVEHQGFGGLWWDKGPVIPLDGVYAITGTMMYASDGTLIFGMKLNDTGASASGMIISEQGSGFSSWTSVSFATEMRLTAADVLTPAAFANDAFGLTASMTRFTVRYVRP